MECPATLVRVLLSALAAWSLAMSLSCAAPAVSKPAGPVASAAEEGELQSRLGIALTPRNFPMHTPDDVRQMFELGRELASAAVFIYPWSQRDFVHAAPQVVALSRQHGLSPMLGLGVTTLSDNRGKLDVPSEVTRAAAPPVSFRSAVVQEAFRRDALTLARLKPDLLCLATEINMLAMADIEEYRAFVRTYNEVYPALKDASPNTKVTVSFQWDLLWAMRIKEPDRLSEQTQIIDAFRPHLDAVVLTSYPSGIFSTPEMMPADFYARVAELTTPRDEIMFMEIGWPTKGSGSEEEQVGFIRRLPALMSEVQPSVLAWPLLHDVRLPLVGDDLFTTGVLDAMGMRKPGYDAFKALAR
jgi:hypothetical protein